MQKNDTADGGGKGGNGDLALTGKDTDRLRLRLASILNSVREGIYGLDTEGRTTFVNPAVTRMLGWKPHEMVGRSQHALIHHSHRDGSPYPPEECPIYAALRDGTVHTVDDEVFWRKDGSPLDVEYSSVPIREGDRITGAVVTFWDVTERRQSEEALRRSEETFRTALANAPIGMALVGLDGRFLTVNCALLASLGYEEDELLGLTFQEITHPDDVDADVAQARRLEAGEIPSYQMEKRYIHKEGHIIWALLSGSLVRDASGAALYFIAQVEDITDRKEAEEARRRLIATLEATPDFVGIATADGRPLYLNRAGRRMVGVADDADLSTWRLSDFHPPWAASVILSEGVPGAVRKGVWSGETALLGTDGREIPVSQVIASHPSADGGVAYLSTIARNIIDRKRAEEAERFLSEASRRLGGSLDLEGVLDQLVDLVVPSRADYCTIDVLDASILPGGTLARHSDPERAPLLERLREVVPPADGQIEAPTVLRHGEPTLVSDVSEPWLRAVSWNEEHHGILRTLSPTSQVLVPLRLRGRVAAVMTLSRTDPTRPYGAHDLAVAEDLADRAGIALENAQLYGEVRQAVRTRDQVLRIVAHDLRNPLDTIARSAELLRERLPADAEVEGDLTEVLRRSVQRANRLIRDLLDVARMEAGPLSVDPAEDDPAELVREAVRASRSLAEGKGIGLEAEVSEPLPRVFADRDRLSQVFSNLIGNAVRFTPEGGRIFVRADRSTDGVRFSVTDSGPGIPEDQLPNVFDPFWQAEPGEGAGLGLAIARGIVEAHGGRIAVESGPEREGTTFHFTLPATA